MFNQLKFGDDEMKVFFLSISGIDSGFNPS
jgi:hypothetical protein